MKLRLKNKKLLQKVILINLLLTSFISLLIITFRVQWSSFDYKFSDYLFRKLVQENKGPSQSERICFLVITDNTYNYFQSNYLDRRSLARINTVINELSPEAVMYDVLFPRIVSAAVDSEFAFSMGNGKYYLPIGFGLSPEPEKFLGRNGVQHNILKSEYLKSIRELNTGSPYYATSALYQNDIISPAAFNSGHISTESDADGIFRHYPLLLKVDSLYFPTVTFSMFLDYNNVLFEDIIVEWGSYIKIPRSDDNYLEKDMTIPIDNAGRIYIPYQFEWRNALKIMEAQSLLKFSTDPQYMDELLEFFEGSFILIGDVSNGISDLGKTPLEDNVPLLAIHGALLNAMLTNSFFREFNTLEIIAIIFFIGIMLGISDLFRSASSFYSTLLVLILLEIIISYLAIREFIVFPLISILGSTLFISFGILISNQIFISKDRAFIKNAFSKYVSPNVVNELISNPSLLRLGGEEKNITILYSDLYNFTSISEKLKPESLVSLLNNYLTEMTSIILKNGGIIDKFLGDGIMAEFGAPITLKNNADAAVISALEMQRGLKKLNSEWQKKGLPEIRSRIGINSDIVIVGNMGSNQVFDYTVIGDAVNFASRLESANKFYNTSILISDKTHAQLTPGIFRSCPLDVIKVKGKSEAVKIHEILGLKNEKLPNSIINYYNYYELALNTLIKKDLEASAEYFSKAIEFYPENTNARVMLSRVAKAQEHDIGEDWEYSMSYMEK